MHQFLDIFHLFIMLSAMCLFLLLYLLCIPSNIALALKYGNSKDFCQGSQVSPHCNFTCNFTVSLKLGIQSVIQNFYEILSLLC